MTAEKKIFTLCIKRNPQPFSDSSGLLKLKKQLPLRFMHRRPSLPPSRRASCVPGMEEEPSAINYIDETEDQGQN